VAYEYDFDNRLTRVTDSNGMDARYKYDSMGQLATNMYIDQVLTGEVELPLKR